VPSFDPAKVMIGPCDLGQSGAKNDANSDIFRMATRVKTLEQQSLTVVTVGEN
jgi:hypothetical protein